jgi:hypothetical protein
MGQNGKTECRPPAVAVTVSHHSKIHSKAKKTMRTMLPINIAGRSEKPSRYDSNLIGRPAAAFSGGIALACSKQKGNLRDLPDCGSKQKQNPGELLHCDSKQKQNLRELLHCASKQERNLRELLLLGASKCKICGIPFCLEQAGAKTLRPLTSLMPLTTPQNKLSTFNK